MINPRIQFSLKTAKVDSAIMIQQLGMVPFSAKDVHGVFSVVSGAHLSIQPAALVLSNSADRDIVFKKFKNATEADVFLSNVRSCVERFVLRQRRECHVFEFGMGCELWKWPSFELKLDRFDGACVVAQVLKQDAPFVESCLSGANVVITSEGTVPMTFRCNNTLRVHLPFPRSSQIFRLTDDEAPMFYEAIADYFKPKCSVVRESRCDDGNLLWVFDSDGVANSINSKESA